MVELYADYISPYCYLAEVVVESLGADGNAIERRAFELWPAGTGAAVPAVEADEWQIAEAIADRLGAPIRRPTTRPRTRKAHEAAFHARERGRFSELHRALYRAYHAQGRDIGRVDVLSEIGAEAGLDALELRIALDIDRHAEAVLAAQQAAHAAGIFAVPVFVRGDVRLSGLQPAAVVRAFLRGEPLRDDDTSGMQ